MILGHSLQSHAANMIYFHFSESVFMARPALEAGTSLGIPEVPVEVFIGLAPVFAILFINQWRISDMLAKNNKIMSMFVLFSCLFWPF